MLNHRLARLLTSTAAIAVIAFATPVSAQSPQAPVVSAGSISVTRQGATTVVTQSTDKGAIDWRSFSVGPQETVRFDQPGRSSITLNRVTGSEISRIDGSILSNGQVWLSNPNGVLIGPSGQVNVGSLLATTGRIDAAEFLKSGRAKIDQIGKDAAIVNGGTINVAAGGYAALAAASIRNEGVVAARAGTVAMGAGKAVTVDFVGDKLLQFQVSQPLDQAPAGGDSAQSDSAIVNNGTIAAEGGTVLLSARAAKGVMDNVVNLKGHVIANSVTVDGGTVFFGDGGTVQVSAKIDASSATGKGGSVAVLGEKVGLMDGAAIDASGAAGGGTVLIGGDWQGKGSVHNAQVAYVAPTAKINVDATQIGNGGTAVVWADDTTRFNGAISAQGGAAGGDGGMVETSGKRALAVGAMASVTTNARAAQAKAGSWLLDPNNIAIAVGGETNITGAQTFTAATDAASTINASTIQSALATGNVVVQTTTANSSGAGDISWASGAAVSYAGVNSLTLQADRDILMAGTISFTGSGAVTLNSRYAGGATGGITVSGSLTTTGGAIVLAGAAGAAGAAIGGGGQNIGVLVSGLVDSGGGAVTINGQGAASGFSGVSVTGTLNSGGGAISITGAGGTNGAPGLQVVGGTIDSAAGNITITGTGGSGANSGSSGLLVSSSGLITTTDGTITASAIGSTGGTSNSTDGVNLSGGTISATGTGAITLTGVRGGGGPGNNFQLDASSLIITNSGSLTINGTATSGGGASVQNGGVLIHNNSAIKTTSGTLTVNGSAALTNSSYGLNLGNGTGGTIAATGSGSVNLNLLAGTGGSSYGLSMAAGTISVSSGVGRISVDSYSIGSGTIMSGGGALVMQPSSAATSIGLAGGAGAISFDSLLSAVGGTPSQVTVGRADLSAAITVGASGYILPQNVTLRTGTGGIALLGAVNSTSAGVRALTLFSTSGTVSLGGNIGSTTALGTLGVTGGLVTTVTAGNQSFVTTGTQSYTGAVRLVGNGSSTATTFSTTGGDISFSSTIDSSATGAEQGLLFAAGTGKVSLAGAVGNTTGLRAINSSGSGSVTVNGLVRSTQSQSYAGSVIVATNSTFRAASGNVIFAGAVNGPGDLTVDTVSGAATAAFAGQVGFTTALNSLTRTGGASAATYFTNAVNTIKTTGTQSYTGPVVFANSAVALSTTNSAVTFSQAVDSLDNASNIGGLTIAAGTGVVSFGNNVGVGTALTSLASTGTGAVKLSGTYKTTGTQSYAGSLSLNGATILSASNVTIMAGGGGFGDLTVTGPATIGGTIINTGAQSYGGALLLTGPSTFRASTSLTFAGAIDAQSAGTAVTTTVTGAGGALIFSGPVGATTPLGAVQIHTNNAPINLPAFKSSTLVMNTQGGTIGQSGAITLTSIAILDSAGGDINLNTQANTFTSLNVSTGAGSAAFQDAFGNLTLSSTNVGGTLTITGNAGSTVNQSSPMAVGGLLLLGSGATYQLTNASNVINSLAASTGAGGIQVVSTGNMSVANIFGTNGITTTGTLRLSVTNTSNLLVNAPVSAGSTFLTAAGTISGASAVTASALTISSTGGSLSNVVVNSQTAAAAAALVSVTAGGITINGVALGATTATTATTASVATVPSVASVTTVVSTPSVATVASIATIAPTTASLASVASVITIPVTPSVPSVSGTVFTPPAPVAEIPSLLLQILPVIPPPNFSLAPAPPVTTQPSGVSAADAFRTVSNTPAGAFVPMSPASVQGSGAPLASSQTIKVDPADTGGANGQVIAGGPGGGGGGSTTILPGLLTERRGGPARGGGGTEPPLAQQPSQMNEEPMLD